MLNKFKELYGEVDTPQTIAQDMINLLPNSIVDSVDTRWLDPGCGPGIFSSCILNLLEQRFAHCKTRNEIIKDNIFMVEYNSYHESFLRNLFGPNINLYVGDYITYTENIRFDIIIGNPPYNCNTLKAIPTKQNCSTSLKWKSMWQEFVMKSLNLLKDNGYLCFIIPSTWLKPDKENVYQLLTKFKIHKLHCFNSYETYKIFNKKAQIPCTYFLLQKIPSDHVISIWDNIMTKYVDFHIYKPSVPIPMKNISILNKLLKYTKQYGSLQKYITCSTQPSSKYTFFDEYSASNQYKNLDKCILKEGLPVNFFKWSNLPGPYSINARPKIILGHSVFGFPYLDETGDIGISKRGKYIVAGDIEFLKFVKLFLSQKSIICLYCSTQYRMRFIDKAIFDFLPDISQLPNFDCTKICDEYIEEYFELENVEKTYIHATQLWK